MIIRNSRGALGASSLACVVGSLLPISWAHAQGAQPAAADGQLEEVVVDSGGTDCDSVVEMCIRDRPDSKSVVV